MRKFSEAIYRNNDIERVIPLEEIIKQEDYEDTISHLFCPNQGCLAKLQYNQKSNNGDYLSKKIGYSHSDSCPLNEENILVRTISFIQEENARVSDEGIDRRKDEAMDTLDDFFNPPEPKEKKTYKPRKKKVEANDSDEGVTIEIKQGRKIKYDPEADIVSIDPESEIKTFEPPFYKRYLHQITKKDKGKNLKTSAKIERIVINEKEQRAQIYGIFENVKVIFEITPTFFTTSRRKLVSSELVAYLTILKQYIDSSNKKLYLTTLCQSHDIDPSNLILFIYEPDFMGFQFIMGRRFKNIADIVIAINNNTI